MLAWHSHLSRLIIDHFDPIGNLPRKLDEILVSRILEYIIVAILCTFKFDHETMSIRVLPRLLAAD